MNEPTPTTIECLYSVHDPNSDDVFTGYEIRRWPITRKTTKQVHIRDEYGRPGGHEASVAPPADPQPVRVRDTAFHERVDAGGDVAPLGAADSSRCRRGEGVATALAAARIGQEHRVACDREPLRGALRRTLQQVVGPDVECGREGVHVWRHNLTVDSLVSCTQPTPGIEKHGRTLATLTD